MKSFFWCLIVSIFLLLILSPNSYGWWDADYNYRINFTIDHTRVDSQLTDFPVLVKLNSSNFNFSGARSDGHDIRFLDSNENTLNFARARHDSNNQVAEYWVNMTTISNTQATTFYLYYGNSEAADVSSPENVWDNDYVGVFHMNDVTSSSISDSSSRGNNGEKSGTNQPQQVEGKVGYAQEFSPTTQYIQIGTDGVVASGGTYSLWFNLNSLSGRYRFIGHVSPTTAWSNRLFIGYDNEGANLNYLYIGLGDNWQLDADIMRPEAETWYHVVLAFSGGNYKVFVDGTEVTSGAYTDMTAISGLIDIGNTGRTDAERVYSPSGLIDEVRISRVQRSDAWIVASFHSENNSLISFSEIEELPKPVFVEHNIPAFAYLNPGNTKQVLCNGTLNHEYGLSTLDSVDGYLYYESFSQTDPLNRTYIYQDTDCTTIDTEINGWFECSFDVYFFAMPGDWICRINATDTLGSSTISNATTYIEEMIAISVNTTTRDFGTLVPGTNTGTFDYIDEIYNEGNVPLNVNVRTFNDEESPEYAMNCSIGNIPFESLRFSLIPSMNVLDRNFAPSEGFNLEVNRIPQQGAMATQPTFFHLHWGLIIPQNIAGTCTGYIRYIGYKAE